jgi:hypothetical protein
MKRQLSLLLMVLLTKALSAQFVDKFGVNAGLLHVNQSWNQKFLDQQSTKDYRWGWSLSLFTEKELSKNLAIKVDAGYLQNGCKDNTVWKLSDGQDITDKNDNLVLHNLSLSQALKIIPFDKKWSPYLLLGFRENLLLGAKSPTFTEPGSGQVLEPFKVYIDDFKKFNLDALIGIGVEVNNLYYFEIEYSPSIAPIYDKNDATIKNFYWGAKLGLNINGLINR